MKPSLESAAKAILRDIPQGERIAVVWRGGKVIEHARGESIDAMKKRNLQHEIIDCWISKDGKFCIAPQGIVHSHGFVIAESIAPRNAG